MESPRAEITACNSVPPRIPKVVAQPAGLPDRMPFLTTSIVSAPGVKANTANTEVKASTYESNNA